MKTNQKRCTPSLMNGESSSFYEIFVGANQDVIWTRDPKNNVIGYSIIDTIPTNLKNIKNDDSSRSDTN